MREKLRETHNGISDDAIKARIQYFNENKMPLQQFYENDGKISIVSNATAIIDIMLQSLLLISYS